MSLDDIDVEVSGMLTGDEEDADRLLAALNRSRTRLGEAGTQIPLLVESYQLLLYWLTVAADKKRNAVADKKRWQFIEDYLDAACRGMNTAIIASMSLKKMERYDINGV